MWRKLIIIEQLVAITLTQKKGAAGSQRAGEIMLLLIFLVCCCCVLCVVCFANRRYLSYNTQQSICMSQCKC